MTVTETDAPTAQGNPEAPALEPPSPATGFAALVGSGDHKTIGRLWIGTSLVYLLLVAVTGVLVGLERIDLSEFDILPSGDAQQIVSLHGIAGPFLLILPLLLGIATLVVPLQVGAHSIAFPRASASAYWVFLLSSAVMVASFLADGGPFGSDPDGVALFLAAFIGVLVALSLTAVSVAATGLGLRVAGMGMHRTPLFTWANVVSAALVIVTLPILAAIVVLAYVDVQYGPTFIGFADQLLARIEWSWMQPTVYVVAIAALGIIGDIVPVAAQTRITLHRVAMGAIGGFAIFAFGAWAMPGFTTDGSALPLAYENEVPFVAFSVLVLLPLLAFAGLMADTLRRGGTPRVASPLLWAIGSLLMLLAGAANGALVSIDPFDLFGTSAHTLSQPHYVLGAALLAGFAGLTYWAPKIFGQTLAETPSKLLALGGLAGVIVASLPDFIAGFLSADEIDAIEGLNVVSAIGEFILLAVALGVIGLVLQASASRAGASDDPWDGHTLEWATASPPAPHNFDEIPDISSEAPIYDARHRAGEADS